MMKFLTPSAIANTATCLLASCTIGCSNIESKTKVKIGELTELQNKNNQNLDSNTLELIIKYTREYHDNANNDSIAEINEESKEIRFVTINDIKALCRKKNDDLKNLKYPGIHLLGLEYIFDTLREANKNLGELPYFEALLEMDNAEAIIKIRDSFHRKLFIGQDEISCEGSNLFIDDFIKAANEMTPEKLDTYLKLLKKDYEFKDSYSPQMLAFAENLEKNLFLDLTKKLLTQDIGIEAFDSLLYNCIPNKEEREDGSNYLNVLEYLLKIDFDFKKLTAYPLEEEDVYEEMGLTSKGEILRMCYSTGEYGKQLINLINLSPDEDIIERLSFDQVCEKWNEFDELTNDDEKNHFLLNLTIPDLITDKKVEEEDDDDDEDEDESEEEESDEEVEQPNGTKKKKNIIIPSNYIFIFHKKSCNRNQHYCDCSFLKFISGFTHN